MYLFTQSLSIQLKHFCPQTCRFIMGVWQSLLLYVWSLDHVLVCVCNSPFQQITVCRNSCCPLKNSICIMKWQLPFELYLLKVVLVYFLAGQIPADYGRPPRSFQCLGNTVIKFLYTSRRIVSYCHQYSWKKYQMWWSKCFPKAIYQIKSIKIKLYVYGAFIHKM